ncbi:hypothetical protein [Oscillatoria salina]|uniref:hypothetical protein n=1 Tax=Oscillatoria salina TaxID=331517 RepID=UPI001CCA3C2C|nr:hypothetical protein [Oscillatoria salina]MBZ8180667.1 hypothetical protein [Oscillatoria salina IIICB1]
MVAPTLPAEPAHPQKNKYASTARKNERWKRQLPVTKKYTNTINQPCPNTSKNFLTTKQPNPPTGVINHFGA